MTRAVCKLCLEHKPLVRSHLIPAALYGYCRAGDLDPVKVGDRIVMPTARQMQDYLLCSDCEDLLNRGGEAWVCPRLATVDRKFPLYDGLTKYAPEWVDGDVILYSAAKNPEIDVDKLTHFAMGIFWKASVHSWSGQSRDPRIELGPYSEAIRRWLRGETSFPAHIVLLMTVSVPLRAQFTFNTPHEGKRQGWRSYFLHVPGVLFILDVGRQVLAEMGLLCLYQSPIHPIVVSESITSQVERMFRESFLNSRKTAAYLRSKARRDEALRRV